MMSGICNQKLFRYFMMVIVWLSFVEGKVQRCNGKMGGQNNNFFYCTKFSVGKGQAFSSDYKIKFSKNMEAIRSMNAQKEYQKRDYVEVSVGVFEHHDWQTIMNNEDTMSCQEKKDLAFKYSEARVPVNGDNWESYVTRTERNWYRPTMYYMAVYDCENEIKNNFGDIKPFARLSLTATMTARHPRLFNDEDHFSYEEQGFLQIDTTLIFVFVCLILMVSKDLCRWVQEFDTYNSPHIWCLISLGIQFIAITCSFAHHFFYEQNGNGLIVCDIFSTILEMIAEVVMSLLILMLANGWMTRFQNYDFDETLDCYGPLSAVVFMIHLIFGSLSYIDRDAHHKYHDFHGILGYCIIAMKLILVGAFYYFYTNAKKDVKRPSMDFYNQICKVGLIYLLSDPFVILSSFFLEEYNRPFYFKLVDQSIHIFTQSFILYQMSQKGSGYNKSVLELNSLPGLN